jgi:hypothetical protein
MLSIVAALMSLVLPGGAGQATVSLPVPTPIGAGPGFTLPAAGSAVSAARPVAGLECRTSTAPGRTMHLELFARGRVVIVPAGIGVAPPVRRDGAHVNGGRCLYPVHTVAPTGVVHVPAGGTATLGQFFDVWGQPLGRSTMAGFHGPVQAYVNGLPVSGDPRRLRLRRHAEIVVESGPFIPPHDSFQFPEGS